MQLLWGFWDNQTVRKCTCEATYWVFHKSCAFLTLAWAVSWVNGGARDMIKANLATQIQSRI